MGYILNQLLNGICQGSIYALMAIGYSVIVGVVGMVTFTYGEVMMIGAFSAYYIFQGVGNNLPLAILAAFAGSFVIGIVIYKLCYEHFFNAPRHISLLCTIGISMSTLWDISMTVIILWILRRSSRVPRRPEC